MVKGGLQAYIRFLEASIIETLWGYKVLAFQMPPYPGVWTPQGKIAFVGLGMKQGAIYHGIAVNLINDLNDYQPIHSCGIRFPVTNLKSEVTIYKEQIKLDSKRILREFSCNLKKNLETRFSKLKGHEFREYLAKKKKEFPEGQLAFRLGQLFFNERRYWEAHEAWECFWHASSPGEFKTFLIGMIQFASALHKLTSKPNLKGALSLLKKALAKLHENRYVDRYLYFIDEQPSLNEYIKQNIRKLEETMMLKAKETMVNENDWNQEADQHHNTGSNEQKNLFSPYTLFGKQDRAYFQ